MGQRVKYKELSKNDVVSKLKVGDDIAFAPESVFHIAALKGGFVEMRKNIVGVTTIDYDGSRIVQYYDRDDAEMLGRLLSGFAKG